MACVSLIITQGAQGLTLMLFTQAQKQKPYLPPQLANLYKLGRRSGPPEVYQAEMLNLWVWAINSSYKAKVRQSKQNTIQKISRQTISESDNTE